MSTWSFSPMLSYHRQCWSTSFESSVWRCSSGFFTAGAGDQPFALLLLFSLYQTKVWQETIPDGRCESFLNTMREVFSVLKLYWNSISGLKVSQLESVYVVWSEIITWNQYVEGKSRGLFTLAFNVDEVVVIFNPNWSRLGSLRKHAIVLWGDVGRQWYF